jgi:catechol 2,3-dioxygenase-like lactoylglutathione lyase family enzyme
MSEIAIRRHLHVNYNCTDVDNLERFYNGVFGTKTVMKSAGTDDGRPFGIYGPTTSKATFVYDHRGGRRSSALELVQWTDPATYGSVYPDPWDRGIQSLAYSSDDLERTTALAVDLGGSLERRGENWLLLRDPEGVWIEVLAGAGPAEHRYLRVVCSDMGRSMAWWSQLGYTTEGLQTPPQAEVWPSSADRQITGEQPLVPTDDRSFGIVLTTWSGPTPVGPTYAMPYHQGLYRMAIAVDDVHQAFAELTELGVTRQSVYTFQLPGTKLVDGLTMLFVRDPDGILVELVERPRKL